MAPTRVWIFPLPAVFESYVRHRDAPPTRQTIRKRGGHGHWRAAAPISNEIQPEDSVSNVEPLGELCSALPAEAALGAAASSTSRASRASFTLSTQGGKGKCFLAQALVEMNNGTLIPMHRLQQFEYVRGFTTELQVMWIQVHPEEMRSDLVELRAGSVSMTVTASHRVMVRRGREIVAAPARDLREGQAPKPSFCASNQWIWVNLKLRWIRTGGT